MRLWQNKTILQGKSMRKKRNSKSKLLMKYIKINFLAIFLPIMIGSIFYCSTVQKNYQKNYLAAIESSVQEQVWELEKIMETISSMANRISLDKEMTPYCLQSNSYTGVNALKKLNSYKVEDAHFRELMIYLNGSDKFYTCNGVIDADILLGSRFQLSDGFSQEEFWKLVHTKQRYGNTKEGQYLLSNIEKYNMITYPLGIVNGSIYGTLIGIYELDWDELVGQSIFADDEIVFICTEAMESIYAQIPDHMKTTLNEEILADTVYQQLIERNESEEYHELILEGKKYIGKIVRLDSNGWYLVDVVAKQVITNQFWTMQIPMLSIIGMSILMLVLSLSIMLSVYNYLPIQRLYHILEPKRQKENKENQESQKDELLFLNEYIRKLLEEHDIMEEQMAANERISRMELIKRLLRSSLDTQLPEIRSKIESKGIWLDKKYMLAMVIKYPEADKRNFENLWKKNPYQSDNSRVYLTEKIYKEYDAFLICADDLSEADKFAEWLNIQLDSKIGVGNGYSETDSLKYSLIEAIIALESGTDQLTFYSEIGKQNNKEFFFRPLESEMKVRQHLIDGGEEHLDEVLNELYKDLLHIRQTNSNTVLLFTMHRIWSSLFENAASLNEISAEKYLQYTTLEEYMERMRDFCTAEIDCRREEAEAKEDSRTKNMLAFVDENYMRPEMSLAFAAEAFHMTSSYFSRIFKVVAGQTFITYITDKRLNLAAQLLLDTDDTISEIVEKVGYSDAASFTRKFTRNFKVSPGNYRKIERDKKHLEN